MNKMLVFVSIFVFGVTTVFAGTYDDFPNPGILADTNYVKAHINDPGVIIVDARSAADYAKGHIPGAINLPGKALRTGGGTSYIFHVNNIDLPEAEHDLARYEKIFSDVGIGNDKEVITYGGRGGRTESTVLFVILDMLGHKKLRHYDGGITEWTGAGNKLETTENKLPVATYKVTDKAGFDKKMGTASEMLKCMDIKNCVFLDTRDPPEFNGEQNSKGQRSLRGGHIPGAIQMDYIEFYRDAKGPDYKLKPYAELKEELEKRGVTTDKTIVFYCWTSTRIGEAWLALRAMGYKNLVNYDHSMTEWNMLSPEKYPMTPGNPYGIDKLRKAIDKNTASMADLKKATADAAIAAAKAQEAADKAAAVASAQKNKDTKNKGICGPTALLALMVLPLGVYRIYRKRE